MGSSTSRRRLGSGDEALSARRVVRLLRGMEKSAAAVLAIPDSTPPIYIRWVGGSAHTSPLQSRPKERKGLRVFMLGLGCWVPQCRFALAIAWPLAMSSSFNGNAGTRTKPRKNGNEQSPGPSPSNPEAAQLNSKVPRERVSAPRQRPRVPMVHPGAQADSGLRQGRQRDVM